MRIGIKGKSIPEDELAPSNFVFLIDVSGSMDSPDKIGILKSGFKLMADGLKDNDRVAIVTYTGEAGVLLESTNGDEKETDAGEQYANFDFRYKLPGEQQSRLLNMNIQMEPVGINNASENMRFAASIAGFGLLMKESKYKGLMTKQMAIDLGSNSANFDPNSFRKEFLDLVKNIN